MQRRTTVEMTAADCSTRLAPLKRTRVGLTLINARP